MGPQGAKDNDYPVAISMKNIQQVTIKLITTRIRFTLDVRLAIGATGDRTTTTTAVTTAIDLPPEPPLLDLLYVCYPGEGELQYSVARGCGIF